jgi:hypothetical protein
MIKYFCVWLSGASLKVLVAGDDHLTADYVAVGLQSAILAVLVFIAITMIVSFKRISRLLLVTRPTSSPPTSLPRPRPATPQTDDDELYESLDMKRDHSTNADSYSNSNLYVPMGPGTAIEANDGSDERQGLISKPVKLRENPLYGTAS